MPEQSLRAGSTMKVFLFLIMLSLAGVQLAAQTRLSEADATGNEILLSIMDKGRAHARATGTDLLGGWAVPLLAVFGILMVVALAAMVWTLQLNRVVQKKTIQLQDLNLELQDSNDRLTAANAQLIMDMEERARMEEERRRLEARMIKAQNYESMSLLAGGVAHDFNNLLTAIIGDIDAAMAEVNLHAATRQNLAIAIGTSRQAGELATRMLDFSGRTTSTREPIDLSEMIRSMTTVLEAASPHHITLSFEFDEPAVMVRGDPVQLRQVIVDLVVNAGESYESSGFLPSSERLVSIRVGVQDRDPVMAATIRAGHDLPPGRYAIIEVADRGGGIVPEMMEKVFDPFFSTKKKGRGLGLAALAGIVQAHAGAVAVHSIPDRKTIFTVILPLAEDNMIQQKKTVPCSAQLHLKGRILLVEDQDGVRKTTARMLESLGLQVLEARNCVIAAAILREHGVTIQGILLDLTISNQDSQDNFSLVRELAGMIPVIVTSGCSDAELQNLPSVKELAGVLKKPYDRPMLVGALLSCFPELKKIEPEKGFFRSA